MLRLSYGHKLFSIQTSKIVRTTQPITILVVQGHVMLYTANVCVRSHDHRPLELKGFPIVKQVYLQLTGHVNALLILNRHWL